MGEAAEHLTLDLRYRVRFSSGPSNAVVGLNNAFDKQFRDHPLGVEQGRNVYFKVGLGF